MVLLHAMSTVAVAASPGDELQVDFVGGHRRIEGDQSPAWEAVEPAEERLGLVIPGPRDARRGRLPAVTVQLPVRDGSPERLTGGERC